MVIAILLILGLTLGSFVNAFVWRHYRKNFYEPETGTKRAKGQKEPTAEELSIVKGRSMCTHCHHELAAKDLIPVVSYLWLRGKCRYCRKPIEDTPLAELLLPLLFVITYLAWPHAMDRAGVTLLVVWLVICIGLVALTIYDLRWQLLPHAIVLPLIGVALVGVLLQAFVFGGGIRPLLSALVGAVVIGGLFYILYRVSNGAWIGGGDITLGALLGLLAGDAPRAFMVIFLASLIGTIVSVPLLAIGKAGMRSKLPFGPFLIAGGIVVVLYGTILMQWYSAHILGL